jgi:hypothetical protein
MVTRRKRDRKRRSRRRRQRGGSETSTAVIIEPRKSMQGALEFVTKNLLKNLPNNWKVVIFPSAENKTEVEEFLQKLSAGEKERVSMKDIGLTSMDKDSYNKLMMSRKLLDAIDTEVFLVVQTDSLICQEGKNLIEKFMKYDYVGAPWKDRDALGNGGFSLRRKSKMLEILEKCPTLNHNEDGFFSGGCDGAKPFMPTPKEAEEFSIETIYNKARGKSFFGIHKPWYHLPGEMDDLDRMCLGAKELQRLNSQAGGSRPVKMGVMAIFKNESMTMREWIEHYKWQGADAIVLINNDSTDDWQNIVKDFEGFVTVKDVPGRHVQMHAYNTAGIPVLKEKGMDVVVVVDLDEYYFGNDGRVLKDFVQETFSKEDRPSGFTCGWSMFGSNGHEKQPASVREGFTKRWQANAEPENGVSGKTVMLISDIGPALSCIHTPKLTGERVSCPEGLQLNHYPIMSKEYFNTVKKVRGDAFTANHNSARNDSYFKRYDNNNVADTTLADQVKRLGEK